MPDLNDWNKSVIDEFHANGGKVGGELEGASLLLLTTRGAKSGKQRVNPLAYFSDGERLLIAASKAGAPTNPDWYYNLIANPEAEVEIGTEKFRVKATAITGEERDTLYARIVSEAPGFGEYQKKTDRVIPVFVLERIK